MFAFPVVPFCYSSVRLTAAKSGRRRRIQSGTTFCLPLCLMLILLMLHPDACIRHTLPESDAHGAGELGIRRGRNKSQRTTSVSLYPYVADSENMLSRVKL